MKGQPLFNGPTQKKAYTLSFQCRNHREVHLRTCDPPESAPKLGLGCFAYAYHRQHQDSDGDLKDMQRIAAYFAGHGSLIVEVVER